MDERFVKGICITISFMILVSLTGCSKKNYATTFKNETAEDTTKVSEEYSNALSGKVKPISDVDIVSKISGRIASINFKEGQLVNVGDVLFTLEDKDIKLQVNQAEAAVNYARANYEKVTGSAVVQQNNLNITSLAQAEVEYNNAVAALNEERQKDTPNTLVKSAEIRLQDAQSKLEKKQQLFNSGVIAQQELDTAKYDVSYAQDQLNSANTLNNNSNIALKQTIDNAEARVKKAEESLRSAREQNNGIQSKVNKDNANIALGQLKQAEAAYETAKSQLDNTVYKSPASGIAAIRNIEVGEMVNTTTIISKVVDLSSVTVEVNVQESMVSKIKIGDKVKILVKAVDNAPYNGEVISINPVADTKSQSYPVKIKVNNDNGLLKGDMFAEIMFN